MSGGGESLLDDVGTSGALIEPPFDAFASTGAATVAFVGDGEHVAQLREVPLTLPSGETRVFLEDGDEVIQRSRCEREGAVALGFGDAAGRIRPTSAVFDCRMIAGYMSSREPGRSFVDRLQAMEGKDGILDVDFHNNNSTDDSGANGNSYRQGYTDAGGTVHNALPGSNVDVIIDDGGGGPGECGEDAEEIAEEHVGGGGVWGGGLRAAEECRQDADGCHGERNQRQHRDEAIQV